MLVLYLLNRKPEVTRVESSEEIKKRREKEKSERDRIEKQRQDEWLKAEIFKIERDTQRIIAQRIEKAEKEKAKKIVNVVQANPVQTSVSLKMNSPRFQEVLKQNGITTLYHFTDKMNLDSIRKNGGLYSWYYCQQNDISIASPGGSAVSREIDTKKGLQDYVRVSFVRDHPMLYKAKSDKRISNPVILEIKTEVICQLETKFATQNAAKSGVIVSPSFDVFNSIRFPLFKKRYFDLSEEERPFYQAEVLVLKNIPIEFISNIHNFK